DGVDAGAGDLAHEIGRAHGRALPGAGVERPHHLDRLSLFAAGNRPRAELPLQYEPRRRARLAARDVPHPLRDALMAKLWQVAKLIRSKNSGPFELTFDIIFKD